MKTHYLIAAIMTPFLALTGFALTDWYLKRDQQPAPLNRLLPTTTPCPLQPGCTLSHGDFSLTLKQQGSTLYLQANQRLKGVLLEVVDLMPPQPMRQDDTAGYRWSLPLAPGITQPLRLRWVAQSHWRNYIGEWPEHGNPGIN